MTRVCVAIPVRERADLLAGTLCSLRACTRDLSVVVLADGPDAATRCALADVGADQLITWDGSFGDPYCFNRMVTECAADLYALLENGARVSPHWLDRLMHALAADETHGIVGPSTNRAWNEQQVFTDCRGDEAELARIANAAAERFGDAFAYLEPLHSLGDFCYAVSRKVIDRIGAGDEGYGEGPCWEMDYNIRAARAGFRGVWAKSAFVWRAPETPRRRAAEARCFPFSKRRYQDHFCALHLHKQTTRYDAHCTGEACAYFAPRELIITRREFAIPASASPAATAPAAPTTAPPSTVDRLGLERPLVSCIMPTANRRPFVPHAIVAFLRQDYEPRELIVVDDGKDSVEDLIPQDDRIRYVRNAHRQSLGNKRNEACRLARGEVIVHWDDDDWHARWRLSYQVSELLARQADICGLDRIWFYDADSKRAWQYRYPGGRSRWLAGGSFCYRRSLWERHRFSDVTVGEDTRFVREAAFANILALDRDDFYVARIHAGNTCRKQPSGASWHTASRESVERIIDRWTVVEREQTAPLITCIMPTLNRAPFVALAVQRFAEQTYPNKELVVIEDGAECVERIVRAIPGARYLCMPGRRTIGEKRNAACAMAQGEIIAQWDDDDWYGPKRLERQAEPIICDRADVTGLRCRWLMTLPDGVFWQVSPDLHRRMFVEDVHGGTLMFRKSVWESGAHYPAANLAEDAALLRDALSRGARVEVLENLGDFVYSRHGANAWRFAAGQFIDPGRWQRSQQPIELSDSMVDCYREAFRRLSPAQFPNKFRRSIRALP